MVNDWLRKSAGEKVQAGFEGGFLLPVIQHRSVVFQNLQHKISHERSRKPDGDIQLLRKKNTHVESVRGSADDEE